MALLNNGNMFTAVEMTDAVNKLPLTTMRFATMFEEMGVRTTSVALEFAASRITLIPDSRRGSNPAYVGEGKREIKFLSCSHLAQADVLAPEDIQDVRAFGSTELTTAASIVNDKMSTLKRNVEMTREMHRLGAVKGIILDVDGQTELLNLFDAFQVRRKTAQIPFPATAEDAENPLLTAILNVKRKAEAAMGGNPYSHFEAIIGSNFYDCLTGNALVRPYFQDWLARKADFGDNDYRKRGFTYGSVTFYEASEVIGGLQLVEPDKGHLYPVGPGIWKMYNAPADWMSTVNTIGLPWYAQMWPVPGDRGFNIEVQANPLALCVFPEALVELSVKKF